MKPVTISVRDHVGSSVGVEITMSDGTDVGTLYLNRDDYLKAKAEGRRSVLDLVSDGCPPAMERMVRGALASGDDVVLFGEPVDPTTLSLAFFIDPAPRRGM